MEKCRAMKLYSLTTIVLTITILFSNICIGNDDLVGNQVNGCFPVQCCNGGMTIICANQAPPATTDAPIFLHRGSSIEHVSDVSIPGAVGGWSHTRTYDSHLDTVSTGATYPSPNGEKWFTGMYVLVTGAEWKDVDFYYSASSKVSFSWNSSNSNFDSPDFFDGTLVKTGSGNTERYTITNSQTGQVLVFFGHNVTATHERGKLEEETTVYLQEEGESGNVFSYDTQGRLDSVTTSQGWLVDYEYITSGNESGKIDVITVSDVSSNPSEDDIFAKVNYTYYGESLGFTPSTDTGSIGDLIQVETLLRTSEDSAEVGNVWQKSYTQYRYFSDHKLKAIYSSGAIDRAINYNSSDEVTTGNLIDTPEDLLQLDDTEAKIGTSGDLYSINNFSSRSFTYYSSNLDTTSIDTVWDSGSGTENLEDYIDDTVSNNLNETGYVKTESINGDCSSCSGSANSQGIKRHYYYLSLSSSTNNDVDVLAVEDTTDAGDNPTIRTLYGINSDTRLVRKALIEDPKWSESDPDLTVWCKSWKLTTGNRIEERRDPSAHYVTNEFGIREFIRDSSSNYVLHGDEGLIVLNTYNSSGERLTTKLKEGKNGTAYLAEALEYETGSHKHRVKKRFTFDTKKTSYNSTTDPHVEYSYTYWGSSDAVKIKTVTLPSIASAQNGSGVATTAKYYFDELGRLRWTKDGEGFVNYRSYNPDTGRLTLEITDVDTTSLSTDITGTGNGNWIAWSGSAGLTRESGLYDALELTEKKEYDNSGRPTKETDTRGDVHYTRYEPHRTIKYPYWNSSTGSSTLPIRVWESNKNGKMVDVFTMKSTQAKTSGMSPDIVPDGITSLVNQNDTLTWTHSEFNKLSGQLEAIDRYHSIPSGTSRSYGTMSTNYSRTKYFYDDEGKREYVAQVVSGTSHASAIEQVNQFLYDTLGRITELKKAVSDESNNVETQIGNLTFTKVRQSIYGSDGYVSEIRNYLDATDYRGTAYYRDFRGFVRGIEKTHDGGTVSPYLVQDLDWRGLVTAVAQYRSKPETNWDTVISDEDYADTISNDRATLIKRDYDDLGRLFTSEIYEISTTNGSKGNKFLTQVYYDRNSRVIARGTEGSTSTEIAYDGAHRPFQVRLVTDLEPSKYSTGGGFQYSDPLPDPDISSPSGGNDRIISLYHLTLDGGGVVTDGHHFEVNHDDTDGINLSTNNDYVRQSYFYWHDDAGRVTTIGNYGSGDTSVSGPGTWDYFDIPQPSSKPGSSSAKVLVTKLTYEDGRLKTVTDPEGKDTTSIYDDLGRAIKTIHNDTVSGTDEIWLLKEYDGLGNLRKQIADIERDDTFSNGAWTINSDSQVTEYIYTDTDAQDNYDHINLHQITMLVEPDGSSTGTNNTFLTYHSDGRLKTRRDQTGTKISYHYNDRGNIKAQSIGDNDFGSGVDTTVQSISYGYDDIGRIRKITSHSEDTNDPDDYSDIENQILFTYNGLGQVTKSCQAQDSGDIDGTTHECSSSTPSVTYAYDHTAISGVFTNLARLNSITHPSSREIGYEYGANNSKTDLLGLVNSIDVNSTSNINYLYNGAGALVEIDYLIPDLKLSYSQDSDGDYEGFDRFGRVKDQYWSGYNNTSDVDRFRYEYDYVGNVKHRDIDSSIFSTNDKDQTYSYDDFNRLDDFKKGTLSGTTISSPNFTQEWTLDELGNWKEFKWDNDGSGTSESKVTQTRSQNITNEIDADDDHSNTPGDSITGSMGTGTNWVDPKYDANGSVIEGPAPGNEENSTQKYTYDAWNRLVKVEENSIVQESYTYDGLNRRLKRFVESGAVDFTYRHFYNTGWQVVEIRREALGSTDTDPYEEYVYHPNHIDSVAIRYFDYDTDGSLDGTYFHTQDANLNISSIVAYGDHDDNGGTPDQGYVLERYEYTPYGEVTILDPDFSLDSGGSDVGNSIYFSGRRLDSNTGLYHYRNRHYSAQLGRFLQKDPIGTWTDLSAFGNAFLYAGSSPTNLVDPLGLQPGIYWFEYGGKMYVGQSKDIQKRLDRWMKGKNPRFPAKNCKNVQKLIMDGSDKLGRELKEAGKLLDLLEDGKPVWNKVLPVSAARAARIASQGAAAAAKVGGYVSRLKNFEGVKVTSSKNASKILQSSLKKGASIGAKMAKGGKIVGKGATKLGLRFVPFIGDALDILNVFNPEVQAGEYYPGNDLEELEDIFEKELGGNNTDSPDMCAEFWYCENFGIGFDLCGQTRCWYSCTVMLVCGDFSEFRTEVLVFCSPNDQCESPLFGMHGEGDCN